MNFIQRPDLPHALRNALMRSDKEYHIKTKEYFDNIERDYDYAISVTTMSSPPRIKELTKRHEEKIYRDPEDLLWAMKGNIIHGLIETNARDIDIAEKRIGITVPLVIDGNAVRVHMHGQMDLYEPDAMFMYDFKYTSPRALMYPTREEYIFQLNALAIIAKIKLGITCERLCNTYIMKDWSYMDYVKLKKNGYPEKTIVVKEQPIWDAKETKRLMVQYVKSHYSSQTKPDNELPFCTKKQRWQDPSVFKVYKRTQKGHMSTKATFSGMEKQECEDYISVEMNDVSPEDYEIREIEAKPKRCMNPAYCPVSGLCSQRQEELRKEQEEKQNK